jgi:transcriptional regulator GlxA family with amidase domain
LTALDAIGPYEILKMLPGAEIRFVAHKPGPILTDRGVLAIGATHSFDETPAPYLVLVPGSEANTATAMADGKLVAWLKQVHETTTWTTSVCSGALVLAAAGILSGRPATTHWAAQGLLTRFNATPMRGERIVRSGKVWTAAGVSAGLDLALTLFGEIEDQEQAEIAQLIVEYDPHPPFHAGHPTKASGAVVAKATAEMARLSKNLRDLVSIPTIFWRRVIGRARRAASKAR